MAKHDDTLSETAAQRITAPDPAPPEPRLRKVPAVVNEDGIDLIARAMQLQRALLGDVGSSTQEARGKALVAICQSWLLTEAARLSGKGGA